MPESWLQNQVALAQPTLSIKITGEVLECTKTIQGFVRPSWTHLMGWDQYNFHRSGYTYLHDETRIFGNVDRILSSPHSNFSGLLPLSISSVIQYLLLWGDNVIGENREQRNFFLAVEFQKSEQHQRKKERTNWQKRKRKICLQSQWGGELKAEDFAWEYVQAISPAPSPWEPTQRTLLVPLPALFWTLPFIASRRLWTLLQGKNSVMLWNFALTHLT